MRDVFVAKTSEYITEEEHLGLQPWSVDLLEKLSALEIEPSLVSMFVRAPNPKMAAEFAYRLWAKWHRKDKGLGDFDMYPELVEQGVITKLDEKDYRTAWADARRRGPGSPSHYGPFKNPLAFEMPTSQGLVGIN